MIAQAVLATLLGMLPHLRHARCVEAHRADIVARADAAHETHGVPPAVLLVVGLLESHWGCNPRSGGRARALVPRVRHVARRRRAFPLRPVPTVAGRAPRVRRAGDGARRAPGGSVMCELAIGFLAFAVGGTIGLVLVTLAFLRGWWP
jgi:hypothetical protein